MRIVVITLLLLFASPSLVPAQKLSVAEQCSRTKMRAYKYASKTSVASPDEDKYDVQYVHLDVEMDNQSVAISGIALTRAMTTESNFALYVFELSKLLAVDSVIIDGENANFVRTDNIVQVFMPVILSANATFSARVYYHGMPDAGSVFFFQSGINNAPAEEWNCRVTYTLSEPYTAKDWWPCKQSLRDKIDSLDIWITVPDSLKAGSNGLLQRITPMPGNKNRYEWKTRYPVAYYLVSVAVASYDDYSYTRNMPDGSNVLVQNYIYKRAGVLEEYKQGIDSTGDILSYFSGLFGTYPFYKEKYGHCMAPVFGGMEHQTMTTLHNFKWPLVAHELAHQWFGDHVTCASWQDVWLNEGFASYAEYLVAEKFYGSGYSYMQNVHAQVLEDTITDGSIYVPFSDIGNPYRIFDGRLSYQKASAVLHMLRYLVNNDELFFKILRQYQVLFAMGNADTDAFKHLAEQVSGLNLDGFFKQWVYGEGYPLYTLTWNQVEDRVMVRLQQQTTVPASVPLYDIPVEIKLTGGNLDTTIKVDIYNNTQIFTFNINAEIEDIILDPGDRILNKETVIRDYAYGVTNTGDITVYPNPADDEWSIINIAKGTELRLTDMSGKLLWTKIVTDNYGAGIPAAPYARGTYILYIQDNNNKTISKKLTRL